MQAGVLAIYSCSSHLNTHMSGHYIISLTSLTPTSLSLIFYSLIHSSLFHTDSAPPPLCFSLRSPLSPTAVRATVPATVPAKVDQTGRRKWGWGEEVHLDDRGVLATAHRWVTSTRSPTGGNSHFSARFHLNLK